MKRMKKRKIPNFGCIITIDFLAFTCFGGVGCGGNFIPYESIVCLFLFYKQKKIIAKKNKINKKIKK